MTRLGLISIIRKKNLHCFLNSRLSTKQCHMLIFSICQFLWCKYSHVGQAEVHRYTMIYYILFLSNR